MGFGASSGEGGRPISEGLTRQAGFCDFTFGRNTALGGELHCLLGPPWRDAEKLTASVVLKDRNVYN